MNFDEIEFKGTETTPEKLIKVTQILIAEYGYDSTTTRMIANAAKVSLSAINFHFGSKEELVTAAIENASEKLNKCYSKLACEVRHFLKQGNPDKEEAWGYLDRFLTDRIRQAFDQESSKINIGLAEHENGLPESSKGIMAQTAIKTNEQVLAELILAVSDKKDELKAAIIARAINAAIMSFVEKPLLNRYMEMNMDVDLKDTDLVEDIYHDYFMNSIRASVVVDTKKLL